jgi:hypothetical protein
MIQFTRSDRHNTDESVGFENRKISDLACAHDVHTCAA